MGAQRRAGGASENRTDCVEGASDEKEDEERGAMRTTTRKERTRNKTEYWREKLIDILDEAIVLYRLISK